jgi:hypothetical protein
MLQKHLYTTTQAAPTGTERRRKLQATVQWFHMQSHNTCYKNIYIQRHRLLPQGQKERRRKLQATVQWSAFPVRARASIALHLLSNLLS